MRGFLFLKRHYNIMDKVTILQEKPDQFMSMKHLSLNWLNRQNNLSLIEALILDYILDFLYSGNITCQRNDRDKVLCFWISLTAFLEKYKFLNLRTDNISSRNISKLIKLNILSDYSINHKGKTYKFFSFNKKVNLYDMIGIELRNKLTENETNANTKLYFTARNSLWEILIKGLIEGIYFNKEYNLSQNSDLDKWKPILNRIRSTPQIEYGTKKKRKKKIKDKSTPQNEEEHSSKRVTPLLNLSNSTPQNEFRLNTIDSQSKDSNPNDSFFNQKKDNQDSPLAENALCAEEKRREESSPIPLAPSFKGDSENNIDNNKDLSISKAAGVVIQMNNSFSHIPKKLNDFYKNCLTLDSTNGKLIYDVMSRISLTKKEQNNPSEHLNKLLDIWKNQYQFSYILSGFKNVLENINKGICTEEISKKYIINAIIAIIPEDETDVFYAGKDLTYICSCGTTYILDDENLSLNNTQCSFCHRNIDENKIEDCINIKNEKLLLVK